MYRMRDLNAAERQVVYRTLAGSYDYSVPCQLHDLDDTPRRPLPPITGGQIEGAGIGRTLTATFEDPDRTMRNVEGINATKWILHPSWDVVVPDLQRTVSIPLGSFVLYRCERDGDTVEVTGVGKGALHQRPPGEAFTVPKGIRWTEAIRRIAARAGELRANMDIPDKPPVLKEGFTVGATQGMWLREQVLAEWLDMLLYYDPRGHLVARPHPTAPSEVLFRTFNKAKPDRYVFLTSEPKVTADFLDFHNEVWYHFGSPTLATTIESPSPIKVDAPPTHPLSKERLAWHGQPARRILEVENYAVKRVSKARENANRLLDRELTHIVTVSANCKPFPFFEPGDLYRFESTDYSGITTVNTWTLPLDGSDMTLGWTDYRWRG